ncbi:MAG TPA: GGDEF domain-containing protein [Desulfuromonadales bacterium]|nr:GGDEF domain-containing protein [Desulfuromonadales bacterium]
MTGTATSGHLTLEIIKLCLVCDRIACGAYRELACSAQDKELQLFWREMAAEEAKHVRFWEKVLQHPAQVLNMPGVFEHPEEVRNELQRALGKVETLLQKGCVHLSVEESLILAYRLEFYMMHPAFQVLFSLLCFLVGTSSPERAYEHHVKHFVAALSRFGPPDSSLELLGETLDRLWQENRRLARAVTRDALTGCLTRQAFREIAFHLCMLAQRQQQKVAVMMIDLDHFKQVNDRWGHQVGDLVLKTSGQIIRATLRASDVVARYGGEEFLVLMPDISDNAACQVANRIRENFAARKIEQVRCTLSAGLALGRIEGDVDACLQALVRQADMNLYQAKQDGRNRVVC